MLEINYGADVRFGKNKHRRHGGCIGRGLGKGKDRDQNMATGNAEGRSEDRRGMAKGTQGQAIVEGKIGGRTGRGGQREREGRRKWRRWQSREVLKGRAAQTGWGRDQESE